MASCPNFHGLKEEGAPQKSVSTYVSPSNNTSSEQDDQNVQLAVPITLPVEEDPLKGDVLEGTLSVRHQVSEEQEEAIHKHGEDSIPQASASHRHCGKLVSLRKSGRRSWLKSKASKSSQASLKQGQGGIDIPISSTVATNEEEEVKRCVSEERSRDTPVVEVLPSIEQGQVRSTSKVDCCLEMSDASSSIWKGS